MIIDHYHDNIPFPPQNVWKYDLVKYIVEYLCKYDTYFYECNKQIYLELKYI